MPDYIATLFRRLRARPQPERQLLAIVTYITAAAVVIAFWFVSFKEVLNIEPASPQASEAPLSAADEKVSPATTEKQASLPLTSQPKTPFQALKEAIGAAVSGVKEFRAEVNRMTGESTAPASRGVSVLPPSQSEPASRASPGIATSGPKTETAPTATRSTVPLSNQPKSSEVMPDGGPAKVISQKLNTKPYSAYATARLVSPPVKLSAEPARAVKLAGRIKSVLYFNLGAMRQAVTDFYNYLIQ